MGYREIIALMKCDDFANADARAIPVFNSERKYIGRLIPVGNWLLDDDEKIELIRAWRQRAMRMFLTRFEATFGGTFEYVKSRAIAQEERLLFMLYDDADKLIGHMGVADVTESSCELDNIIRGVAGGDPRLIYFSEKALLNWCFKELEISQSDARVLSYNRLVISLHEEVGYKVVEQIPLRRRENNGFTFHEPVEAGEANVKYTCTRMVLKKDDFCTKAFSLNV